MADKTLNTRILLKYDTLANWEAKNTILKMGEVGFAAIDVNIPPVNNELGGTKTDKAGLEGTNPTILFKIGDGETPWKQLNWANALAADVYGWAKQANLPVVRNDGKDENGTDKVAGNVISGISWDGTGIKYTTASVATSEGMAELQAAIDAIEKDIEDNRDAWAEKTVDTNDNTTYAFDIVDGKLQVTETPHALGVAGTPVVTSYDFVTPNELNTILSDYYTKNEIDNLVKDKLHTQAEIETIAAAKINALIEGAENDDTIANITNLVEYVNNNADAVVQLNKDVATANANASKAVTTANGAAETAGQALEKAEEALEGAEGATASAAAAKASEENAKASENAAKASEEAAAGSATAALASQNAASASASEAAGSATAAGTKAGEANTAKEAAKAAQGAAEGARDAALQAKTDAETAKQNAVNAQVGAETAKSGADTAKQAAEGFASAASTSADNSEASASAAAEAQGKAEAAQSKAEAAQSKAEKAQAAAAQSVLDAAAEVTKAEGFAGDADTAKQAAKAAQAAAEAAQSAAEASNTSATAIANAAKSTADAAKIASDAATQAVEGLHAIATSGSTDDLVAGTEFWTFDCGGAE